MKKGLLGSTALVGAAVLMAGAAGAAEAPTWKLGGNMNFQAYFVDSDRGDLPGVQTITTVAGSTTTAKDPAQDHGWYFGVDEAELKLDVSGSTDNGLDYGFKIELNANTTDGAAADEARISLGGAWGTLQLGDEDGAEDAMNYGGENLLGATGSWDGDGDDVLLNDLADLFAPTITGDTSDSTKITYYSPRFSGLQVGGSLTPADLSGDNFKLDTGFEDSYSLGVNYDGEFSGLRVRGSAVFTSASAKDPVVVANAVEDISAFSVGGIVNFQQFAVGANFTDNGESATFTTDGIDDSYWNVAASFSQGPISASVSYFARTIESTGNPDVEPTAFGITGDYSLAPGLSVYAEYTSYDSDTTIAAGGEGDATVFIAGANVSF